MKDYDKVFLKKLIKQDADAFGTIYNELVDQFYRYIKSHYTLDEWEIHDILGDIFLKVWQALPRLDVSSSLSWFLWTIAKNHIKDHFKRNAEIPFSSFSKSNDEWDTYKWEDGLHDPDDVMQSVNISFTHQTIQVCISQLEDTYKDPILLKYVEEYSYEEIAKTLRISQDAVRQRISRWLKRLAEALSHLSSEV